MPFELHNGDSRDVLDLIPTNSIDSCVTDPPYALVSIGKRFGADDAAPAKAGVYARASAGFMGQKWDTGETAFDPTFWREVLRVLKPGAHLLAFGGTRSYHRLAVAIEDAGFEIRDQIGWLYGSGFPKSHDAGNGWGTALKPAWEPIVLARKPLIGTVAKNVLEHGTGAINVDGCRVGDEVRVAAYTSLAPCHGNALGAAAQSGCARGTQGVPQTYVGRWPANIIHDGSEEVLASFPQAPGRLAKAAEGVDRRKDQNVYGAMTRGSNGAEPRSDSGSAARFFYCAKASKADREEGLDGAPSQRAGVGALRDGGRESEPRKNTHPTVKPTALMRYLCRLITPPGGTVLDPFLGSGSTGKAAIIEGFNFIGIEREADYLEIAKARIGAAEQCDPFQ